MTRYWITALLLAGAAPAAWGYAYQAQTGALSYSFFNLSPYEYTLTPYGGGANPQGLYAPSASTGWGNTSGTVGFFNPEKISGGSCKDPSTQVRDNTIFYNEEDVPITVGSVITMPYGSGTTATPGHQGNIVEFSTEISTVANPPAIADSWTLAGNGNTVTLATLASAGNMFISGIESDDYPFCAADQGLWYNSMINPPQRQTQIEDQIVNTPAGTFTQGLNPIAAGFTTSTMNLNAESTSTDVIATGGLWSGVYNPNLGNLAVNSLSMPMYPVNLSAYVAADEVNGDIDQYASPIYGGHMTLAIGDPFLVSSHAAKILWFLVTNTGYAFGPDSLTSDDITHIQNLVVPPTGNGVFESVSISSYYATWLLDAPGQVASTLGAMNQAASTPITQESVWGKVFSGLVDVATDVAAAMVGVLAGPEASVGVEVGVAAAEGTAVAGGDALSSYSTNQITADFTTTVSLPAPVAQDAPPVINPSYSSTDLLGMLLTNVFVQAEVNNGLATGNPSSFALWSNYSISTDTDSLCTNINVVNNLFPSTVDCGSQSGTSPIYDNVLSLHQNSSSDTQLNLWSAVLTGADVSATNGYLLPGSPSTAVFQPPTQLVNLTGASSYVTGIDFTFALDTGLMGIASYTALGQVESALSSYPPTSVQLVQAGTWTGTQWGQVSVSVPVYSSTVTTAPGHWYYDSTSGTVTVTGLEIGGGWVYTDGGPFAKYYGPYGQSFENGAPTLDMTTCAAGSGVVITATPTSTTELEGSLSCAGATNPPGGASGSAPATAPLVNLIQASPIPTGSDGSSLGIGFAPPAVDQVSIDSGVLTVLSYEGWSNNDTCDTKTYPDCANKPFSNAPDGLTLNLADCAEGSDVNLYLYPMGGTTAADAIGYLACADGPPVMPYGLCTQDPQATGGVVVGLKGAPASDGAGATFDFGCACIPQYLGGPALDTTATTPAKDYPTFWQTGGTDANTGQPNGLMVGATASNPTGLCN
jgi:hypothetical protein